ncbi:MAG TPA: YafY family protein [Bryobacteraceae bacterium]|nr:YafY family protein [Bryobacteraceae bacterium]
MRRADRLFQIVQHLRGRRLTTAAQLARWLTVSERTVYRDIRDLSLSGVPVEGEAGVGYRLSKGFDLPPIMFTLDEVDAMVTGARMVEAWSGETLAAHARSALAKIALALPPARREEIARSRLFAPGFHVRPEAARSLEIVRQAILQRRKLRVEYTDSQGRPSRRAVRPMAVYFWGTTWTLAAWCESRHDFRNFRLDRMGAVEMLPDEFQETPGQTLEDFVRMMRSRTPRLPNP